ncbi:---NA--- [Paramuricea clavata]|uniref:---NA n=1 Tax=Paramuricea clavata TaxID=317549 RepID=A0A6S7GP24_PARCT|nr:---NA--- [Paramuricea clavata]
MARDARWRTWDLDCLQETLVSRQQHENEIEPLIVPGCTREITSLNLGSIVLPKEAFFTSNDAGARLRARGRGRSLTNRALGIDKPSRRPGEKNISHEAGNPTVDNPKPTTLGSQFFGSRCLYEELFPSLDQSSTKKSDPSLPIPPVWSGKQKSKRGKQNNEQATNNKSSFLEKSTTDQFKSKQSDGHDNSTNNGQKKLTSFLENSREILEQSHVDSDTNRDETKLPSSTFYSCANDVVTNVKKFVETKDKPRSDQLSASEIPMNDKHVTTETSNTNDGESDSQFNTVGFGRIEAISSESDWQSDEEEFEPIENKISLQSSSLENRNSVDCLITTESKELDKDKQSEKLNMLSHKLEIDDYQNSNPKDCVQEIQWIDSENNDKFCEQYNNDNDWQSDEDEFGPIENKISLVDCLITTESEELHKDEQSEPLNMLSHKLEIDDHQNSNPKDCVQEIQWIDSENNDKFCEQYNNDNDWQSDEDEFGPIENKISLVDCLITTESEELHKDEQSEPLNMLSHKLEIDDHQNSNPKDCVQEIQWIDSENNDKFCEQYNNDNDWQSDEDEFGPIENKISLVDCLITTESEELHKDEQSEPLNMLSHKLEIDDHQNSNPKDCVQEIQWIDSENNDKFCEQYNNDNDWQSDEDEFGPIENKISLVDCLITTESEELHKDEQSEPLNMLSHKLEIDDHQNSNPKDYVQEIEWIDSENDQFSEQCNNDKVDICDQMSDYLEVEDDQNSTSLKDVNFQETDWIESKDNLLFQKYGNDDDKISSHLLDQLRLEGNPNPKDYFQDIDLVQNDNSSHSCDQLSAISNEESLVWDKTKHLEISDSYEQLSSNGHLSPDQDAKTDHTQPIEGSSTIISASTNHLLSQSDSEGQECIETNDTKENLEESLNMSSSDIEMEPCNVLLENLPLALTEEKLQEIIEPYGEMESYNFNINDDSSKTCTIRMPNSMSGELLVVSLDGLEVDGYRIKAQMDDS